MNKAIHGVQRLIHKSAGVIAASFLFINFLHAQTGPGGVGNADGNSGQPENLIWLDAANIVSGDGTDVSGWQDASGNDFHLGVSSVGGSGVPTFRSSSFNYLEFNEGENDRLVINPLSKFPATEITTFILYRTNDNGEGILSYDVSGGGNEYLILNSSNVTPYIGGNGKNTGANFQGNVWSILNNSWRSSDGAFTMYKNGAEEHSSVHRQGNTLRSGGSLSIGSEQDGVDSGYDSGQTFEGDIAEIIIYDAFLNDAQRIIVENYLNAKYGIAITNDYYTGDTPGNGDYDYNVAGIGYDGSASHTEANSAGFIVSTYNPTLDTDGEYLIVGHDNTANTTEVSSLQSGVEERWSRTWYMDKTLPTMMMMPISDFDASITFDLDEAYPGGKFPKIANNYVLLKYNNGTGTYDSVSVGGINKVTSGDQITFRVNSAMLTDGYYTLGTTDATASPVEGVDSKTWYVFQDGDWDDPTTWTTDASTAPLFKNPDNETPDAIDDVIIRSGRTVTIQAGTDDLALNSIKVDGNLDLTTSIGHDFNIINGRGEIRMAGNGLVALVDNFPSGDVTGNIGFADADNGGIVVITAAADITLNTPRTFRHMRVNLINNTDKIILGEDISLNGNLEVRNGNFQFGDGTTTDRIFTVNGNVLVTDNGSDRIGSISTSTANARHTLEIKGNFTNNGAAKFTNRVDFASDADRNNPNHTYYQNEANNGRVDVYFTNDNINQTVNCNNTTFFYRIVIDKGIDDTYELSLKSTAVGNFRLLGYADDPVDDDEQDETENTNAFALINGTAKIGSNVEIPVLSSNSNYGISSTARLWVNGGKVVKYAGAIVPYGVLEISSGSIEVPGRNGVTLRENGLLKVNGGTVITNQIRTSIQGSASLGGYHQSGGSVTVDGDFGNGTASNNDYYNFSMTYTGNVFIMSGGTLTVKDIQGPGAIFINSDPGNINVTGGSLIVESGNTNIAKITSRAPFYNMYMRASSASVGNIVLDGGTSGSSGSSVTLAAQPLVVINDLILYGDNGTYFPVTFSAVTSDTNANDVYIGGSLRVEQGAQYVSCFPDFTDGSQNNYNGTGNQPTRINTTYFNQTNATSAIDSVYWENWQYFDYDGDTDPHNNENMLELGNFVLDRDSGNELRLTAPGPDGGLRGNNQVTVDVNGDAEVRSGTFDQGRLSLRIWGNIVNNDRFGTYYVSGPYPTSGGTPNAAQIRFREDPPISITTTDGAIFGNVRFRVNSNTPVELTSDVIIERMQYQMGYIYLKNYNLQVNEMWDLDDDQNPGYFEDNASSSLIDIQPVSYFSGPGNNASRAGDILIYTDGKASDGGLSLKITDNTLSENSNRRRNNTSPITFPVGFTLDGGVNIYNRPAQVKVKDFVSEGYITIRPVSEELQTTELAGGELLEQYWRVSHDFASGDEPTVAIRFYYYNQDGVANVDLESGATNEASYVPGYVLDGSPYTRIYESDADTDNSAADGPDDITDVDEASSATRRTITFNGSDTNSEFDQSDFTGFKLVNANFTAGEATRFVGAPEVYYTRRFGTAASLNWRTNDLWTLATNDIDNNGTVDPDEVHDSRQPNANAWPGVGDIAIVGWVPWDDPSTGNRGKPHGVEVNTSEEFAELRFTQMLDGTGDPTARVYAYNFQFRPTVCINPGGVLSGDIISGEGMFWCRSVGGSQVDPDFSGIDMGQFVAEDSAYLVYESTSSAFVYNNIPTEIPNIIVATDGWGAQNKDFEISTDTRVRQNFELLGNVNLVLSSGVSGDITVDGDLRVFRSNANGNDSGGNGEIAFPNDASRTIEVFGNLELINNQAIVQVRTPNTTINVSELILHGNIIQNNNTGGGLQLYTNANEDYVSLTLKGTGSHSYTINSGAIANFHSIVLNKGTDQTSTFIFNDDINLPTPTDIGKQPIEIVNGILILDDAAIDITLTDATRGNFSLPNTVNPLASSGSGGLEIRQGVARINGDDTGIILDGLLRISGGELDMDDGANNGNNFIEYSSSGQASLEITGGTLTVGSQIRRGLNSNTGVLQYAQSGGTVVVGKNAVPEASRGVFEVTNGGSYFEHTGGSLTLVRDNNSSSAPSLLLEPASANIADGTTITIGNGDTPTNQDRFGIQSSTDLAEIEIASDEVSAKLYNLPMTANILDIVTDADFDANGFDLSILENLNNDGTFVTSGNSTNNQTIDFPISSGNTATITGSGTTNFWNFEKSGAGILALSKNITVNNNGFIYGGTLNTQSSAFNIKKDLLHDGIHTSAAAGPGIIFNGTQKQILDRSGSGTSELGVINLNNASGLLIRDTEENFVINEKLTLTTGVFDVGGNLIEFPEDAFIENGSGGRDVDDFNVNNMIQTNSAIRDFGIRKYFNALSGGNETFAYPVGLVAYTPVVVNINDIAGGNITVRPVRDIPPIAEDIEDTDNAGTGTCTDPDITDADNVLQYYWIIKSSGVSGFKGGIQMYYDPNDVKVTSPYTVANYGPARIYNTSSDWDKVFTTSDFNELAQEVSFPFTGNGDATLAGIYTAGVTLKNDGTTLLCGAAIPDQVPQFITNDTGGGGFFTGGTYVSGIAPVAGETPDITIKSGDELTFDQNKIRTRKITVESGGILIIQNGTNNHNLGFVTGEGTIRLESDDSSIAFPTGDYEDFFPDENCNGGGGLEYAGSGSYSVLADLPNIRRVIFTGSGDRTLPSGFVLNVCEDIDIQDNVEVIIGDNSTTTVRGNVYKTNSASFDNGGNNSKLIMAGSSAQFILGDFTADNKLSTLEVDNAAGVSVVNSNNQDVEIDKELIFTNGRINTNANNVIRMLQGSTVSGYSPSRYVNGPMQVNMSDNDDFILPVGKGSRYGLMRIDNATYSVGSQTLTWQVEYFNANPNTEAGVTNTTESSDASIETISGNEYWKISDDKGTTPSGTVSAGIGLSWDGDSDVSTEPEWRDELTVMVWDSADEEWDNAGGMGHGGSATEGTFVSATPVSFSEKVATLGSTSANNPLPVELISFSVKMQGEVALLHWATASEKNNDFFEIQRSVNGQDWKSLGTVKGAGDSHQELSYSFTDKNPLYGLSYYRLRQVDFDGQFEFSNIVVLENFENPAVIPDPKVLLYPNPASLDELIIRAFNLQPWQKVEVSLLDVYGKQYIYELVMPDELEKGIKVKQSMNLPGGLYLVSVKQGSIWIQKKLILK